MYLGLDLSLSSTGVAVIDRSNTIHTVALQTDNKDYLTTEARITAIVASILKVVEEHRVEYIVFEGYAFGSGKFGSNNLTTLAELKGVVLHYLHNKYPHIKHITVTTQQMKKYVTGKGILTAPKGTKKKDVANSKKQIVLDAINKNYNLEVTTFDEADAVGLALICRHLFIMEQIDLPDNKKLLDIQQEVIEVIIASRLEQLEKAREKLAKIQRREERAAKKLEKANLEKEKLK